MADQNPRPSGAEPAPATDNRHDPSVRAATRVDTGEAVPAQESKSVGELLSETMEEVSTLFRQEVELAKAEVRVEIDKARAEVKKAQDEGKKAGRAAGKLGAAGAVGYLALILLTFAAAWGLAAVMPVWLAFLIVAVVVGLVAFGLYSAGRKQMEQVDFQRVNLGRINPKPDAAIQEMKETKEWAKHQ